VQLQSVKIHACRYSLSVFRGERFPQIRYDCSINWGMLGPSLTCIALARATQKGRHTLSSVPALKNFEMGAYRNGRLPRNPQPLCRRKFNAKLTTCAGLRVDKYHNLKDFLVPGLNPPYPGTG
jgi:hypothetical protein